MYNIRMDLRRFVKYRYGLSWSTPFILLCCITVAGCSVLKRDVQRHAPGEKTKPDYNVEYQIQRYKNTGDPGAYEQIRQAGADAIPALTRALDDSAPSVRLMAVELLGGLNPAEPRLAFMLEDPVPAVVFKTACLIASTPEVNRPDITGLIISAFHKWGENVFNDRQTRESILDKNSISYLTMKDTSGITPSDVRVACAVALITAKNSTRTVLLYTMLSDHNEDADSKWLTAAFFCAEKGDARISNIPHALREPVLLALIILSKDTVCYVRTQAASALGKYGDTGAILPLCELVDDENRDVQDTALIAIDEILTANRIEHPQFASETNSAPYPQNLRDWCIQNRDNYKEPYNVLYKKATAEVVVCGRFVEARTIVDGNAPEKIQATIRAEKVERGELHGKILKIILPENAAIPAGSEFRFYLNRTDDGGLILACISIITGEY